MQTHHAYGHSQFSPHRPIRLWLLGNGEDVKGLRGYSRGQSVSSLLSSHAVQPSHCQDMGIHCIFPLRQANCPGLQRCSGTQTTAPVCGQTYCPARWNQLRSAHSDDAPGLRCCGDGSRCRWKQLDASDSWGKNRGCDDDSQTKPPTLIYYRPDLSRSTNSRIFDQIFALKHRNFCLPDNNLAIASRGPATDKNSVTILLCFQWFESHCHYWHWAMTNPDIRLWAVWSRFKNSPNWTYDLLNMCSRRSAAQMCGNKTTLTEMRQEKMNISLQLPLKETLYLIYGIIPVVCMN